MAKDRVRLRRPVTCRRLDPILGRQSAEVYELDVEQLRRDGMDVGYRELGEVVILVVRGGDGRTQEYVT